MKMVDGNELITSSHMYFLCEALSNEVTHSHILFYSFLTWILSLQFPDEFNALCIELNVRGVAVDLNGLEKLIGDKEALKRAEINLAKQISKLADLVRTSIGICKEVALTAFSLDPTQERFDNLVELATKIEQASASLPSTSVAQAVKERSSAKEGLEDANSGLDSNDDNDFVEEDEISSQDNDMTYLKSDAASLGVSESLVEDLVSVVDSSRWRVLSWKRGWPALKTLCHQYLTDQGKSVVKELKFVQIDHSQYEDGPRMENGEYDCVEKGYENPVKRRRPYVKAKPKLLKKSSSIASKNSLKQSEQPKVSKKKELLGKTSSEKSLDLAQTMTTTVEAEVQPEQVEKPAEINKVCLPFGPVCAHVINLCNCFWQKSQATSSHASVDRAFRFDSDMPRVNWRFKTPVTPLFKPAQDKNPRPDAAHHFAPVLSTLNMEPKVILKRMIVKGVSFKKKTKIDTESVPTVEDYPKSSGETETDATPSSISECEMRSLEPTSPASLEIDNLSHTTSSTTRIRALRFRRPELDLLAGVDIEPRIYLERMTPKMEAFWRRKHQCIGGQLKTTVKDSPQSSSGTGTDSTPLTSMSCAEKDIEMEDDQPDGRIQNKVLLQRRSSSSRELSLI